MQSAEAIIEQLKLQPHPEGGWYRETWRAEATPGERAGATAIYFLLEAGQRSHWHRVDAAELWLWHAGAPLLLRTAPTEAGPISDAVLGPDIALGEQPQRRVPPHHWQATETTGGWALVSCIVAPGFDFAGFTLAPAGWSPGGGMTDAIADVGRVRAVLLKAARAGEAISYSAFLAELGHRFTRPKMRALCRTLGRIDEAGAAVGEPELAVLVVRESDRLPGQGWWAGGHVLMLGYDGPWEGPKARALVDRLQQEAFAYWRNR